MEHSKNKENKANLSPHERGLIQMTFSRSNSNPIWEKQIWFDVCRDGDSMSEKRGEWWKLKEL
jgi:hypothetical protein